MKCKTLHTKIIFFTEGSLLERDMEEIKIHLENCSDCAAFANEMNKTLAVIQDEKTPQFNPYFYTRVKARLENIESKVLVPKTFTVWNRVLQPAFFSILLIAGMYMGFKIGQLPSAAHSPVVSETEIIPYLNEMNTETIENYLMQ